MPKGISLDGIFSIVFTFRFMLMLEHQTVCSKYSKSKVFSTLTHRRKRDWMNSTARSLYAFRMKILTSRRLNFGQDQDDAFLSSMSTTVEGMAIRGFNDLWQNQRLSLSTRFWRCLLVHWAYPILFAPQMPTLLLVLLRPYPLIQRVRLWNWGRRRLTWRNRYSISSLNPFCNNLWSVSSAFL